MAPWTDEALAALVDTAALAEFIRSGVPAAELEGPRDSAAAALADVLADAYRDVPEHVAKRLVLEVGAEFVKRGDSPTGAGQFATMDGGAPVRSARDPLSQQWPILRRYVLPL